MIRAFGLGSIVGMNDQPSATMENPDSKQLTTEEFLSMAAQGLGDHFRVYSDGIFHWVTPFDDFEQNRFAEQAAYALARVGETIPGLVITPPAGGWPTILFSSTDEQLAYDHFLRGDDTETEAQIINGGMWCSWPIGHLAIPVHNWDALDAAFGHELVHATLSGTGVPIWLQEGLATELETSMGIRMSPLDDLFHWKQTLQWWRSHPAEKFWTAEAFSSPESSRHAYELAQVMALRLTHHPERLHRACTIGSKAWQDQDAVLREILGLEREQLFQAIIGEGRKRGWLERFLYWCFVGDRL